MLICYRNKKISLLKQFIKPEWMLKGVMSIHLLHESFCRAMLCKRGLCRHAVSVCLSVCPFVTFVNSVKTNKYNFNFFRHRVAKPF